MARRERGTNRSRIFYGWWVVGASFGAAFGSVVFFNPVLGVFVTPLRDEFGWDAAQLSLAITLGSAAGAVSAPAVGWLVDRRGARAVVPPATLAMVVCLLALARMQALWQLLLFYSIGRALSQQAVNVAAFTAVSNWFIRRRAIVVSIVGVAPRLGLGLLPLLVVVMIDVGGTWRAGWLALAVIAATVGVLPPLLFMHRRPEDRGLRPDGDAEPATGDEELPAAADLDFSLREAVRTRSYWLLGIGIALIMFCGGATNLHQIPHLEQQGLARTEAALVVTVFSIAGALGALLGGAFATRITVRWTMVGSLGGMSVGILMLATATTLAGAMLYAVTYGLFSGSAWTLMQVVYADYFGRRALGVIRGSAQPVQLGFNAAGPLATGLWFNHAGSYDAAFALFALLFLVAAAAVAFSPRPGRVSDRSL